MTEAEIAAFFGGAPVMSSAAHHQRPSAPGALGGLHSDLGAWTPSPAHSESLDPGRAMPGVSTPAVEDTYPPSLPATPDLDASLAAAINHMTLQQHLASAPTGTPLSNALAEVAVKEQLAALLASANPAAGLMGMPPAAFPSTGPGAAGQVLGGDPLGALQGTGSPFAALNNPGLVPALLQQQGQQGLVPSLAAAQQQPGFYRHW